jgi:tetratricopeptide (TPR) repeat protein
MTIKAFASLSTTAKVVTAAALVSVVVGGFVAYRAFVSPMGEAERLGDLLLAGDVDAVIERGERMLSRGSTDIDLMVILASAYLQKAVDIGDSSDLPGKAVALADRAIAVDDQDSEPYRIKGQALILMGDYAGALDSLRRAVSLDARSSLALIALGQVLESSGQINEAETHYKAALAVDALSDDAELGLARASMTRKEFSSARERAQRVLDRTQSVRLKASAQETLGIIASQQGDLRIAVAYFRESVAAVPTSVSALVGYGDVLLRLALASPTDFIEATEIPLSLARRALELEPANVFAHALSARIYGLRGDSVMAASFASSTLLLARGDARLSEEALASIENRFGTSSKATISSVTVTTATTSRTITPLNQ